MNTAHQDLEPKPLIYLDHPVVGLTSPEFQHFANEVIKAIGRMTKKMFKAFGETIVRVYRYLERKSNEAAEIHNRANIHLDERYTRNWFYIRSSL